MQKKHTASLAIEATISFTVFLCFMFFLLSIVKLSMVYITINDVTSETAKKVAGMAYPISFVNTAIDDKVTSIDSKLSFDNIESKLVDKVGEKKNISILQYTGLSVVNTGLDENSVKSLLDSAKDGLSNLILGKLFEFKQDKQTELVANVYLELLEDTQMPIDTSRVTVDYFTFPQSDTEFKVTKTKIAEVTGLEESDLSKDDVILAVSYDYHMVLPFLPAKDITIKSIAVERAWLNGGNHATPSKREGIPIDGLDKWVIVSATGSKYHKETCRLKGKTIRTTTISGARADGYKPCKICRPDVD